MFSMIKTKRLVFNLNGLIERFNIFYKSNLKLSLMPNFETPLYSDF